MDQSGQPSTCSVSTSLADSPSVFLFRSLPALLLVASKSNFRLHYFPKVDEGIMIIGYIDLSPLSHERTAKKLRVMVGV
jgi:hypothetical protein